MATSHAGAGSRGAGQIASAAVGWLALLGVILACARPVALEDRACPCAQGKGFVCCERTGLCVKGPLYQAAACLVGRDAASAGGDLAGQFFGDDGGAPSIDAEAVAPGPAPPAPDASTPPGEAPVGRMQCPYNPACYVEDEIFCEPGIGLVRGTYYDNPNFTGIAVTRLERGLSFDWETGSPDPMIASDTFVAFWNTSLLPELDGDYTFFINADDGFRFWLNDELLLDWWQGPLGRPLAITVPLERYRGYDLLLEHFDETGRAFVDVTWQRGTGPRTAIPDCLLSERPIRRSPCDAPAGDCVPPSSPYCPKEGKEGYGLDVSYYRGANFTDLAHHQFTSAIALDWSWLAEASRSRDHYTIRVEGLLAAPRSETFTFFLIAEGDATLTVAGREVRKAPSASGPMFEVTLTMPLTAERRVPVRIDYAPSGPAATAALQLRWKSASTPKGAIPSCRLYPPL